jgi:homoserine kinase
MKYFENIDDAFNKYGTSISGFGSTVTTTVDNISNKSKTATEDIKDMAIEMKDAFEEIADTVSDW